MLRIASHGHSVERFMDFIEDISDLSSEEFKQFRTYFQLLVHESLFHSYIIRMIGMIQEYNDIEDDQEQADFYEIAQYAEGEYIRELQTLPGDIEFDFHALYYFTCYLLDYLFDEAGVDEAWDGDIRTIELHRGRFVVYLF
jgi:hypothetical protein